MTRQSTAPRMDVIFTGCRLLEGGRWHGLLSQAHASICHCYAKHCFGIEEIESRSRPAAVLRLSCPYHFHQPDQKHIELPPTEGQKVT